MSCRISLMSLLTAALLLAGCGGSDDDSLSTESVELKVLHGEQPVTGAIVSLVPAPGSPVSDRNLKPAGTVGADGSVTLTTYEQGDGAPAGKYKVTVEWIDRRMITDPTAMEQQGRPNAPPADRFEGKYATYELSPWEVTIEEGGSTLETINIP